jgi:hypothetical protein
MRTARHRREARVILARGIGRHGAKLGYAIATLMLVGLFIGHAKT